MGRSNFNSIVPRAYVIFPLPMVTADTAAGADYISQPNILPLGGVPDAFEDRNDIRKMPLREFNASNATRPLAPTRAGVANRQGVMYSFVNVGGTGTAANMTIRSNAQSTMMTNPIAVPSGAQAHFSGLIDHSWRAAAVGGAAALANTDRVTTSNVRQLLLFVDCNDASQVVTRPAVAGIFTPTLFTEAGSAFGVVGAPLGTPQTQFPGAVKGFYITVPFGDADLASGQASNTTVRRIVCPMDIRLHEVCFSSQASGAGNLVRILNVTKNALVTQAVTTLTGATATTDKVTGASLSSRNISKGDVLDLQAITVGTGFTSLAAMLTGHTTGHYNVTSPHLDFALSAAATVEPSTVFRNQTGTWLGRTGFSGPCRGGAAAFQLPVGGVAISQTNFGISRIIAPFDCFAFSAYASYRSSAAGNSILIRNVTKSLDILASTAAVAAGLTSVNFAESALTNNTISRGDVIELRATTGGTAGFPALGAVLVVHVRGHVNPSPAFD